MAPLASPATPKAQPGRPYYDSALWVFLWFGVITALVKATLSNYPWKPVAGKFWPEFDELGWWTSWLRQLAFMVRNDILFATACSLIAQILLRLARPKLAWQLAIWWFFLIFCTAGVAFTMLNVPLYRFTFAPLNYTLIDLLGGFKAVPSLMARFLTPQWAIASAAVTVIYLILVALSARVSRRGYSRLFVVCEVTFVAALLYYITYLHPWFVIGVAIIAFIYIAVAFAASGRIVPGQRILLMLGQMACIIGIWLLLGQYRGYRMPGMWPAFWHVWQYRVPPMIAVPLLYLGLLWLLRMRVELIPSIASVVFAAGMLTWITLKQNWVTLYVAMTMGTMPLVYLLASWISGIFQRRKEGEAETRASCPRDARPAVYPLLHILTILALIGFFVDIQIIWSGPRFWWRRPHDDRRITDSAYYSFLRSCVYELVSDPRVRCGGKYEPDDVKDFQTFEEAGNVAFPTPGLQRRPKNVILFVMESVGTRYMGIYGGRFPTTPNLEAAAGECLIFNNVYAPVSNSGQSLISMLLSVYAPMCWREYTRDHPQMDGAALSQILKDKNYRTAFMAALDWTYAEGDKFVQNRGFDNIWDFHDMDGPRIGQWGVDDAKLIDKALSWTAQEKGRPFFLMCWSQGTHHPYDWSATCKSDYVDYIATHQQRNYGMYGSMWWDMLMYANGLRHLDEQLGRLFKGLKEAGLADDTLVVLIGDHGECFGEPHASYGHAGDLYQEGINIPCILWNPALFKNRPRSQTVGNLNDIPATILDFLNMPAPGGWQGRSLVSPQRIPRVYFYGPRDYYMLGLRERLSDKHDYKYICNTLGAERRDELYDLRDDPDEQVNLASDGKHTALVRRYRQRLAAWLAYEMDAYSKPRR